MRVEHSYKSAGDQPWGHIAVYDTFSNDRPLGIFPIYWNPEDPSSDMEAAKQDALKRAWAFVQTFEE